MLRTRLANGFTLISMGRNGWCLLRWRNECHPEWHLLDNDPVWIEHLSKKSGLIFEVRPLFLLRIIHNHRLAAPP